LGLGWDDYLEAGGVCVVEWADLFPELLPPETVWWRLVVLAGGGRRVEREMR
jgi:tRNA threonylcarbamoyladenosine biosynthesis protein TsaE